MNDFKVFHLTERQLEKIIFAATEKSRERDDLAAVRLACSMAASFAQAAPQNRATFEAAPRETVTMNSKPAAAPKPQTEAVNLKELM